MNIAIITPNDLNNVGGVEIVSSQIKKALEEAGHKVDVFDRNTVKDGKTILDPLLKEPILAHKIGGKFNKKRSDYDAVICNGMFGWNIKHRKALNIYHGTYAGYAEATKEGTPLLGYIQMKYINGFFEKKSGENKTVAAVSDGVKRNLKEYYGLETDAVIENAVDLNLFKPRENKKQIREKYSLPEDVFLGVFVGRWEYGKGVDLLLKTATLLDEGNKIAALTNKDITHKKIISLQGIKTHNTPEIYSAFDYFILPSKYEGCPLSLIEAMACGLPFIINGKWADKKLREVSVFSDYIVDSERPDEYAEKINQLREEETKKTLSKKVREYCERNHNIELFKKEYIKLIETL